MKVAVMGAGAVGAGIDVDDAVEGPARRPGRRAEPFDLTRVVDGRASGSRELLDRVVHLEHECVGQLAHAGNPVRRPKTRDR